MKRSNETAEFLIGWDDSNNNEHPYNKCGREMGWN